MLQQRVEHLRWEISASGLASQEEYGIRIKILQELGFVEENFVLTRKGQVAAEVFYFSFPVFGFQCEQTLLIMLVLIDKFS
jgi:hypothetical protein